MSSVPNQHLYRLNTNTSTGITLKQISATTEVISAITSRTDENGLLMEPVRFHSKSNADLSTQRSGLTSSSNTFYQLSTATAHRAESLIPKLKECASGLPATFQSIDKMQELINKLRENVAEAQQRVDDAEASFGSSLSVSKLFGVFSRKDKPNTAVAVGPLKVLDTKAEFERMRAELKSGAPSAS